MEERSEEEQRIEEGRELRLRKIQYKKGGEISDGLGEGRRSSGRDRTGE